MTSPYSNLETNLKSVLFCIKAIFSTYHPYALTVFYTALAQQHSLLSLALEIHSTI